MQELEKEISIGSRAASPLPRSFFTYDMSITKNSNFYDEYAKIMKSDISTSDSYTQNAQCADKVIECINEQNYKVIKVEHKPNDKKMTISIKQSNRHPIQGNKETKTPHGFTVLEKGHLKPTTQIDIIVKYQDKKLFVASIYPS